MDYLKIYKNLIRKAKHRKNFQGYVERHHVIPKSFGGSNKRYNIVKLSAREHFIAHRLLVKVCDKIYGQNHILTKKSKRAVYSFVNRKSCKDSDLKINSRIYSRLKKEQSISQSDYMRGRMTGDNNPSKRKEVREKISNTLLGRIPSANTKKKMSAAQSGNKNHFFGKKHSDITRDKQGQSKRKKYKITFFDNSFIIIVGIKKFCRENGYNSSDLFKLIRKQITRSKDIINVEKLK